MTGFQAGDIVVLDADYPYYEDSVETLGENFEAVIGKVAVREYGTFLEFSSVIAGADVAFNGGWSPARFKLKERLVPRISRADFISKSELLEFIREKNTSLGRSALFDEMMQKFDMKPPTKRVRVEFEVEVDFAGVDFLTADDLLAKAAEDDISITVLEN